MNAVYTKYVFLRIERMRDGYFIFLIELPLETHVAARDKIRPLYCLKRVEVCFIVMLERCDPLTTDTGSDDHE